MHALHYVWNLGDRFDRETLHRRVAERAELFEALPGLVAKAFLIDEENRLFGGFYVWLREEDADRFLSSELYKDSCATLGTPQVSRYEVPGYVGPAAESAQVPPRKLAMNHAMVYVRNVERSLAFYEGKLGFRKIEGMDGYARLQSPCGLTTIAIHLAEAGRELPGSEGIRLYFEIEELDPLCERLARQGVEFMQTPQEMPWGWRHAYLKDPDGHEISLYRAGEKRFQPSF